MIDDADITAHLTDEVRALPYPGRWSNPPFAGDGAAVLARDGDLTELRVDRRAGRVDWVDLETGAGQMLAPSLRALGELAAAYATALRETRGAGDRALRRIERTFLDSVRTVSADLAADGTFWAIAAEELGDGVLGGDDLPEPLTVVPAGGSTVVIAMPMLRLHRALADEGLTLSGYRTTVSYVTLSGDLGTTLANTAHPGAQASGPARVLVVDGQSPLTADALAFPALRTLILVEPATLPENLTAAAADLAVVTVGPREPFARIADLLAHHAV
ncbi:hypothetical protein GS966_29190 [Rhodococcus hoagii]|nr:hypothetical protein [Prescottella equi]NKZ88673.1 hypothetical protein [Prescottella equi]NKZ93766.1 hypothetical protein [Prescottella equi]NKZ93777.1 hypothetical protein [Prescottella equi]